MKWEPQLHQRKALKFVLERPAAGLLLDPGLGKTSTMLAALKLLEMRALVIAPLRVCYEVWPREIEKWDNFHELRCVLLHGRKKELALHEDADLYCINPEGLPWLVPQWPRLLDAPTVLIVDESTKFKHSQTQRFRLLKQILPYFDRRYILTGTPVPNGLLDLFGQIYILDLGQALGRFITAYRNRFFYQTGFGGYEWRIRPGADEEIFSLVKPIALRLDAQDYLEMPPVVTADVEAAMSQNDRRRYFALETQFFLELGDNEVTAVNSGALSIKLRQFAGGFIYGEGKTTHALHETKLDMLQELLEEISGQPTLVAYQFQHEGEAIGEKLDAPRIGGGVPPRQTRKLIEQWNAGALPVLLVHPAAAGHGLNLQAGGRHLIWYSLPWDQEHYDQLLRRLWRQGQTKPVHQYHLLIKDTIDEIVLKALKHKTKVQDAFLSSLKSRYVRWRKEKKHA